MTATAATATFALRATELADVATPRTGWSVGARKELIMWDECHRRLRADAHVYRAHAGGHSRVVLFGDSITESWRGTSYGRRIARAIGVPAVLNTTLATRWPSPLPLGISADCTQHLLWRMAHGELSPAMERDSRMIAVLLIGTNNLGRGHSTVQTVQGIVACARHLLNRTRGQLLVNALLPRGDERKKRVRRKGGPRSFTEDIVTVNAALNASVHYGALGREYQGRVHFVDCGSPFYAAPTIAATPNQAQGSPPVSIVRRDLMPDRLHPNARGHRLWGRCLTRALLAVDSTW